MGYFESTSSVLCSKNKLNTEYLRVSIIKKGYRAIPYLQSDVHIAALAFDVVGIEGFGVTALENMALAA